MICGGVGPLWSPALPHPYQPPLLILTVLPTRAHPPHSTTPCHYMSYGPSPRPCGPPPRRLGWGGPSTCSGTGRLGGRGGPLWVPGLTTRRSMLRPAKLSACLAPTRAHPPHSTTPCHYMSYGPSPRPCGPPPRRLGGGGPSTCSGTGRVGGRGG